MSAQQEFTPERTRRRRSRYWLAIGFGLAAVCVSGTALAALPATVPPETDAAPEPTIAPTTTADVPPTTTPPTTTVAPTPGPTPTPPPAPVVVDLVPLCTSSEDMDAGTRTFRLDNNGTEPVEVTLRNVATGESVSGTAAPGQSTWEVPAGDGANTTEVVANGQVVATSDSTNLMCGALHGQAECNPSNGTTTITWTVSNNDGSPAIVLSDSRDVDFQPNPDAPHGESIGIEVIDGPADDDEITETVTIELAGGDTTELTASVTAAACTGPTLTPDVSFTFTKTPSVPTAGVGDTVEYVYCGQNNGALPLEVVRLVDDRLGVVLELPGVETVVAPGDSLCNTDIGQPVDYTVRLADLGTTITNHAVVTVRTVELAPRVFQATATATVEVALSPPVLALLLDENVKTWVCHRTLSATNPYNLNTVSGSSTDASGHTNHKDDIIPPGPWGPGQNYDAANGAIWVNDCKNIEVLPVAPTLTQATCLGGVIKPPVVTVAGKPLGVAYTVAPTALGDGTADVRVTVTATLTVGYDWGSPLTAGWTASSDGRSATWTGTLNATSCAAVTPAVPTLTQAVCTRGALQPPSLEFAPTDNVTYTANPSGGYAPGDEVIVTATLTGGAWAVNIPADWRVVNATTATYTFTFAPASCIVAIPVEPDVIAARCNAGVVEPPRLVTRDTDGVIYTYPHDLGDGTTDAPITVTAALSDGYAWADPLPDGWVPVGDTTILRFELTVEAGACTPVTPAAPTVTEAVCTDGLLSPPTLVVADTPQVTYVLAPEGPYSAGDTVTVTATLAAPGVGWGAELPDGWTVDSPTTATLVVVFADVGCTPVSPGVPVVEQATCTAGVVVPSTVTLPTTPEGITYSMDPEDLGDGTEAVTVTVTAELADGFEWGQLGNWTPVNDTTATLTLELAAASCDEVTPAAPTVTEAVCADGVLSPPTLVVAVTDQVTYVLAPEGPYSAGQTVVVTATLDPAGVGWGAELPDGWTVDSPTTATLVVVFADVACTPVSPGVPVVEQATCTAGVVVPATVTLPTTPEGITYSMDPEDLGDGTEAVTVTVTAELADGFEWGQLGDWTRVNDTTATLTLELAAASCDEVTPAGPTVTEAVCADGVLSPPTMVVADTDQVTYVLDPEGPYSAGQTVVVTATLDPAGVGWGAELPDGWTVDSPTTATLVVRFADVVCTPVSPGVPVVEQATCTAGVVVPSTVTLPTTPEGVTYSMDPQDLGDGTEAVTVTVTAELADGFEWGQLGDWTPVNDTTATLTLELAAASCDEVTPAAPTVTEAVCADGVLSPPTMVVADTDGVTYTVDPGPPYVSGQTVIVTAILDEAGVAWGDAVPVGWTAVDDQTATLSVTFDDVSCIAVSPADPPGPSTEGIVELPVTPGITYTVDTVDTGSPPVVRAVIPNGYRWGPLPDQWTQVDATTAVFSPASPTPTPGVLAHTGPATLALQSLLAAGLLMVGFGLLGLGRRRVVD